MKRWSVPILVLQTVFIVNEFPLAMLLSSSWLPLPCHRTILSLCESLILCLWPLLTILNVHSLLSSDNLALPLWTQDTGTVMCHPLRWFCVLWHVIWTGMWNSVTVVFGCLTDGATAIDWHKEDVLSCLCIIMH